MWRAPDGRASLRDLREYRRTQRADEERDFAVKAALECAPCFIRQALDAARMATDDETVHEQVVREALRLAAEFRFDQTPVHISRPIHAAVRNYSGCADPYREVKQQSNTFALGLYPEMNAVIDESASPFETAVRLAIAGNIIDFGVMNPADLDCVHETVEHALKAPLDIALVERMGQAVQEAHDILYLADNAGEIVFDRLLLERMPLDKITVVVRGEPIINDATMDDARAVGLTEIVNVIESGTTYAGTILETCSDTFRERFARSDLVIAKGQGNYEALNDADKPAFFLLKAKCAVVARHLHCAVGDIVLAATPAVLAMSKADRA